MTIDPKWLREKVSGGAITSDRRCVCGYNLRGLKVRGTCPECGREIPGVGATVRALTSYPDRVLARHATGATLMACGAWMMAMTYLALWLQRGLNVMFIDVPWMVPVMLHLLVVLPGSILWSAGVVMVSARDPEYDGSVATPLNLLAGRVGWMRPVMILGQGLWVACEALQITGIMIEEGHEATGVALQLAGYAAAVGACLTLAPVGLMMRELAYHGSDDYAANRFQTMTIGMPIAGAVLTVLPIIPFLLGVSRTATFMLLLILSLICTPAVYLMLRALWSVATTARWARHNAAAAAERDRRFLERTRRQARA